MGAETISAKMVAAVGAILSTLKLTQEETKASLRETETPCEDNICEECPKFETSTCDLVKSDEE